MLEPMSLKESIQDILLKSLESTSALEKKNKKKKNKKKTKKTDKRTMNQ